MALGFPGRGSWAERQRRMGSCRNCCSSLLIDREAQLSCLFQAELTALSAPLVLLGLQCLLIGKDPEAGQDWRQKENGAAEGEMVRQHHQPNGHDSEQTPWDSGGQSSLVGYSPWVTKSQTRLSDWRTATTLSTGAWGAPSSQIPNCRDPWDWPKKGHMFKSLNKCF